MKQSDTSSQCGATPSATETACPRPAPDGNRCPLHRPESPDADRLRETIRADFTADDDRRRTYAGIDVPALDLSGLALDATDRTPVRLLDCRIAGTLTLTDTAVGHRLILRRCRLGELRARDAGFDHRVTLRECRIARTADWRRATFADGFRIVATHCHGSIEAGGTTVSGWFTIDDTTVTGNAQLTRTDLDTVQLLDSDIDGTLRLTGATVEHATLERVGTRRLVLDDSQFGTLRVHPADSVTVSLCDARIDAGRFSQPDPSREHSEPSRNDTAPTELTRVGNDAGSSGSEAGSPRSEAGSFAAETEPPPVAAYDLTDATVGDVSLDTEHGLDRYRLYRTRYDGFPFAACRAAMRDGRWTLHEWYRDADRRVTTEGLERTYLRARQGASDAGDSETAAALFVRELRYRRRRYAAHLRDPTRSPAHRGEAGLRWLTNAALDWVARYGERPQRVLVVSTLLIGLCGVAFPAFGGLTGADGPVSYRTDGLAAVADGLYFSVVTFTTLGVGDFVPASGLTRTLAGIEALVGAFLVALFVFSLGRRVTR